MKMRRAAAGLLALLLTAALLLSGCAGKRDENAVPEPSPVEDTAVPTPAAAVEKPTGTYVFLKERKPGTAAAVPAPAAPAGLPAETEPVPAPAAVAVPIEMTYMLNTNTMRFHLPGCASIDLMNEEHKLPFGGTREEAIAMGYSPCGNCHP